MTPQERELAKKRALAKARARARASGETMLAPAEATQAEAISGNSGQGQPALIQGQIDQVNALGSLDRFLKGSGGRAGTAALQTANGFTWGGLDRGMGWMERIAPGGAPKLPGQPRDHEYYRSLRQDLREQHPTSALAGDVLGVIGGGLPLDDVMRQGSSALISKLPQGGEAWKKGLRYGTRAATLAGEGLAHYGLWKMGSGASNLEASEDRDIGAQERVDMVIENPDELKLAAAAGPVASGVYRAGRTAMTGRATPKNLQPGANAPSLEAIQGMKSQAYKDAEALGVAYTPDAYANMVAKIENVLDAAGSDPQLNASVTMMLNNMQKRVGDQPITMQTLDKVRQQVRENVISPAHRAARDGDIRLGNIIIDEIDEFIASGIGAVSNNGRAGSEAIRRARSLNSVWRKSQSLQDAVENAQLRAASTGSGGNFENALRQEIRKIFQNPKKVAGFTEGERKLMRGVIEGDMGQNILRNIGKLSPQGNGLMAALGVGTTAANPVLAPIWLGAMGAKHLAQRGIKNKFNELDQVVRSGANDLPMKNITPQGPTNAFQPAGPPTASGQGPQNAFKDKALDATALGLVASGAAGSADAQETSGLQEAQERVAYIESAQIRPLEADLQMLNDPKADPRALQEILRRRVNPQLTIDGVVGPQTLAAVGQLRSDIQGELQIQRDELEKAQGLVNQAQQRQVFADNQTPGWLQTVQDQAPLVGTGLGLMIGMRGRGGAVAKSKATAQAAEKRANALVNTKPIAPTSITGPNSINERAPNMNEFWRLGGAGDNVPFKTKKDGTWVPRPNAAEPSQLYKPNQNPFRTSDVGWIGGGLGEAALSTQYLEESKSALKEARADADRYKEKGDIAGYEDAMARVRQRETEAAVFTTLQRLGLTVAGGRFIGSLKSPYASARPNVRDADVEQGLVKQGIRKKNAKSSGETNPN